MTELKYLINSNGQRYTEEFDSDGKIIIKWYKVSTDSDATGFEEARGCGNNCSCVICNRKSWE